MFVVGDIDRLVRQHDGNPLMDPIRLLEARVIEQVFVGEIQQALLVGGTGEDLQSRASSVMDTS